MQDMKIITENIMEFVKDYPIARSDEATANVECNYKGEIVAGYNMSTAFSWMIQAAGKCRSYASDIIYDIEDIKKAIESFARNISNGVWNGEYVRYIGVRDMGVDSNTFIHNKINNQGCWNFKDGDFREYYKNLFRVTITEGSDEYTGRRIIKIVTDEIGLK